MSAAICMIPAAAAGFESILALPAAAAAALRQQKPINPRVTEDEYVNNDEADERPPGQFAVWTSIQAQKPSSAQPTGKEEPYVHPLLARRSSSLLSQKSLETCTESLGSESGSDDFFSSDDFALVPDKVVEEEPLQQQQQKQEERAYVDRDDNDEVLERATKGKRELVTVNYHCSISRRSSLPRSFPPPLPSISRGDGPCLKMRPHRVEGRLVVEAVAVPSQNYLHAERHNGRLLLSFIDTTSSLSPRRVDREADATREEEAAMMMMMIEEAEADPEDQDEAEEEEEVQVVDRGTVVEVKVSTQPQQLGTAATKVHRSSIVINKFVSCTPAIAGGCGKPQETATDAGPTAATHTRRLSTATTTAAAAAVAASSVSALSEGEGRHTSTTDNKLLFTSRSRSREGLLHDMRRCRQLRKPLFIWEPCCIATSS